MNTQRITETITAVIVPAFNASPFLRLTINSVIAQSWPDWELIVVDDGSSDDTANIVRDAASLDARIRLVRKGNGGIASTLNAGLGHLEPQHGFVAFLDHDDLWQPDTLAALHRGLTGSADAMASQGIGTYIDADGNRSLHGELERNFAERRKVADGKPVRCSSDEPVTFECMVCQNTVPASCILVRREAIDAVGQFDSECDGCQDWDYWLRLTRIGPIAVVNAVTVLYRRHPGNFSIDHTRMERSVWYIYAKLLASGRESMEYRRTVVTGMRENQRGVARLRMVWAARDLRHRRPLLAAMQAVRAARDYARSIRSTGGYSPANIAR